jgi:hypothetical protein
LAPCVGGKVQDQALSWSVVLSSLAARSP